ncbi:alpha/beta fold hydrolase [Cryptosporangium minutisporangium]|uniref:Alpha/beta hydrolase n=1 Tax=Cryptosporangium minutisporangium TaxID=113569 RepID=A0ABP6T946_9ACTN
MTDNHPLHLRLGLALIVREASRSEHPVLLLHGAAGPASLDSLRDHLATFHRVLAPVHPGWDGTPRPETLSSVADLAATYLNLLEEQEGPPPGNLAALRTYAGGTWEDPTLLDRIRELAVPALLIWGEHDAVVSPEFGRRYAEAIPGSRFALVPGGHLPVRDAPDATFAAIDAFLGDTPVKE